MTVNIPMCLVQLILCALLETGQPAPITTPDSDMDLDRLYNSKSLIAKITDEIRRTHKLCIDDPSMSIDSNGDLSRWEYMIGKIGIQSNPRVSPPFSNPAVTFSQIWTGLDLHKGTLEAVKDHLSCKEDIEGLVARLDDLLHLIGSALEHHSMSPSPEAQRLPDLDPYQIRVVTHVTLVRLLHFAEEVSRFLRFQTDQLETSTSQ